jgi:flagellar export protein FliJ
MKHFSFRLEPVLTYRKLREDGEEQKLKLIHAAIIEAQRTKEELRLKIEGSCQMLAERSRGTIDIDKVRSLTTYIERLRNESIRAGHVLLKLEQDRLAQVARLLEARRGREVVEKLKENSLGTYKKEIQALEQKLLDELSVTQFGRMNEQELPSMDSDS